MSTSSYQGEFSFCNTCLINDWVIDVWSWCKKCDRGGKGRGEGGGGGPAQVWGSDS